VDHIAEQGFWSGKEHRARVGPSSAEVLRDLLRLHRAGKDITKIVQPLCKSCNITKYWRHRKNIEALAITSSEGSVIIHADPNEDREV
jgi:hypothetical protein